MSWLMRRLYRRSRTVQWFVAICLLLAGIVTVGLTLSLARGAAWIVAFPLLLSSVQIAVAPALRLFGIYRYHSPMLKVTIRTRRIYEIHGGTVFDYLLQFRWKDRGAVAARRILILYLEGLLDIADCVSRGELPPSIRITGTSYFFREASVRKLGFSFERPSVRLRANLFFHLLGLTILYSFARGRPSVPPVWRARNAVIRGDALLSRRPAIEKMIRVLRREPRQPELDRAALCA